MERTECPSSTNFSTSTVRNSSCRRSIATSRGTGVAGLFMLAVYTLRLHPPRRILHTFQTGRFRPSGKYPSRIDPLLRKSAVDPSSFLSLFELTHGRQAT